MGRDQRFLKDGQDLREEPFCALAALMALLNLVGLGAALWHRLGAQRRVAAVRIVCQFLHGPAILHHFQCKSLAILLI